MLGLRIMRQQSWGVGILESEGLVASLIAGATFGITEMVAAMLLHGDPLWPIQAAASLFMQEHAFDTSALAVALPLGLVTHVCMTLSYGFLYGLVSSDLRLSTRLNASREAALGALMGAVVWLLNFQLVARLFYPWLFATNQVAQFGLHVFTFGVVLALLFRRKEQKRIAVCERESTAGGPTMKAARSAH